MPLYQLYTFSMVFIFKINPVYMLDGAHGMSTIGNIQPLYGPCTYIHYIMVRETVIKTITTP